MSRKFKFKDPTAVYFVTFTTVYWIDVFTRRLYKDLIVDSLNFCIESKGLVVYAWAIMSNHIHLIIGCNDELLENILRDMKKFTSKAIIKAIEENQQESRKEWMLWMFERAGTKNSNNSKNQFWQQHNQPEVLSNKNALEQKLNYIHNNPVKAGYVENPVHYLYSSAIDYADGKGLVKVELAR
jgi:REP element-mobilizing transposase RayT